MGVYTPPLERYLSLDREESHASARRLRIRLDQKAQ